MSLYDDISNIIINSVYNLTDILHRINVVYIDGALSDTERDNLIDLAREHANPEESLAPLVSRIAALETWQLEVEGRLSKLETGSTEPVEPDPSDEWPEYVQPTGVHNAYYNGDKVTWNGKHYICIAPESTPCVWDPDSYPAYWELQSVEN